MPYEIRDTDTFRFEYNAILLYLVDILDSPFAAANLMESLDAMKEALEVLPESHPVAQEDSLKALGLRKYLVRNYVVLYRIKSSVVFLEHMFHTKQNYEAYV